MFSCIWNPANREHTNICQWRGRIHQHSCNCIFLCIGARSSLECMLWKQINISWLWYSKMISITSHITLTIVLVLKAWYAAAMVQTFDAKCKTQDFNGLLNNHCVMKIRVVHALIKMRQKKKTFKKSAVVYTKENKFLKYQ